MFVFKSSVKSFVVLRQAGLVFPFGLMPLLATVLFGMFNLTAGTSIELW